MLKRSRYLVSIALVALFAGMGIAVLPTVAQAKPAKNCAPGPGLDLSGCNYMNADLMGDNFSGSDLQGANLSGADLNETNFTKANLRHANLASAGMVFNCSPPTTMICPTAPGSDFFDVIYAVNPDFAEADLRGANLSSARLGSESIQVGTICVPYPRCAGLYATYPDSILTGVRSGDSIGIPTSLPSGWALIDGYLTVPTRALTITTPPHLPVATHDVSYSMQLSTSGGNPPSKWSIVGGMLPKGLRLNRASGIISGSPRTPGTFTFSVLVRDTKTHQPTTQRSRTMTFTVQVI